MTLDPRALLLTVTAILLAAGGLVVELRVAHAQQAVPAPRQASILTRALAYDRNMKERAGDSVSVGVLYACSGLDSEIDGIAASAQATILINWGEIQKEGASFSCDLVRLAKGINDVGR
jgi:hypothetical protein